MSDNYDEALEEIELMLDEPDDNDFVLDQMVWSFSRIQSFENCKHEWYLNYIEEASEDKRSNIFAEFGTFCHKILQKYLQFELEKEELLPYYEEYFDDEVTSICLMKGDMYSKLYEVGHDYFSHINIEREKLDIIGVEQEIVDTIGRYKVKGIIDLLYKEGDEYVIMDHKSARSPLTKGGKIQKNSIAKMEEYKRQLYLYAHLVQKKYGKFPKYLEWNFFRDNQMYRIEFKYREYIESLKWVQSVIEQIYEERKFAPHQDYFYCNHLCDFRTVCQYN